MGKLFVAAAASALVLGAAFAAAAQVETLAPTAPEGRFIAVKVEQVTAAAHLTYRDAEHNALIESHLMMVGEVPALADGGCRTRDTATEAAPTSPRAPSGTPHDQPRPDVAAGARPKGRWIACS